jgi:cytochrome c oxidase subunit 3
MTTFASPAVKTNRPNLVAVGTIVWLSSELMFFAALFAMYFTTRAVQGPKIWAESTEMLNIPFSATNTTILVLSSVTCQYGVFAAERFQARRTGTLWQISKWGMREWFALTFLMGAVFIGGQVFEYAELVHEGLTLSSDHRLSWFACNWWFDRIFNCFNQSISGTKIWSLASYHSNCGLLLLALC